MAVTLKEIKTNRHIKIGVAYNYSAIICNLHYADELIWVCIRWLDIYLMSQSY